jgi:hypothetical protein
MGKATQSSQPRRTGERRQAKFGSDPDVDNDSNFDAIGRDDEDERFVILPRRSACFEWYDFYLYGSLAHHRRAFF